MFKGADRPVEMVSWNDIQEFIRKLNAKEGHSRYRLPTEAEWEYAARAGSRGWYCFGHDKNQLGDYAWYEANSEVETHPVGQKKANAWGLYDMHGNVWEWVQDWVDKYRGDSVVDPQGPPVGKYRVFRGGGWYYHANACRSAYRGVNKPVSRSNITGFRLVLSLKH
jgi:formylglycine-generating enzyme required for sulfatase activity